MSRPRLLFFHSEVRTYRVPIFDLIAKHYDCQFLFLNTGHLADQTPEAKDWRYKYLKPIRMPGYSAGVAPGVIKEMIGRRKNYDVVIFSGIFSFATHAGVPLAKLSGKKVIIWDETWLLPTNWQTRIITPYLRWLIKKADALVEAGTKTHQFYLEMGAAAEKCFRAPNCADNVSSLVSPKIQDRLRAKLQISKNEVVIGYLGRVVYYKALDNLIESFCRYVRPKFPQARLLIVGDGEFAPRCRKLIGKMGGWSQINWVGGDPKMIEPVSHLDFINYLSLTDIFVLPGRFVMSDNVPAEAWGLLLNESMSLGKPVVSTKSVAAAYDMIRPGVNGEVVQAGDVDSLTKVLLRFVGSRKHRESAGQASKKVLKGVFTYDKMYKGFSRAISHTLGSKVS